MQVFRNVRSLHKSQPNNDFFCQRARRGHNHHPTHDTRIITTNNRRGHQAAIPATHVSSRHDHQVTIPATHVSSRRGHHIHHGTTVVAENIPSGRGHSDHGRRTHVTTSRDQQRYYYNDPSTIHGLWNKILGTVTGNRRLRRHGDREMRKARQRRHALRVQRDHATGHMTKLRKIQNRHDHKEPVVIAADSGRGQGRTPWLHYKNRALPPYHGMQHRILGFFTGGERRAMGEAMAVAAEEDRKRERRRRREESKELGRRYRDGRRWA